MTEAPGAPSRWAGSWSLWSRRQRFAVYVLVVAATHLAARLLLLDDAVGHALLWAALNGVVVGGAVLLGENLRRRGGGLGSSR